jgi:hypothetical protein
MCRRKLTFENENKLHELAIFLPMMAAQAIKKAAVAAF